jgi:hypothetical protein
MGGAGFVSKRPSPVYGLKKIMKASASAVCFQMAVETDIYKQNT